MYLHMRSIRTHTRTHAHTQDPSFVQPSTKQRLFELTDLKCKVQGVTMSERGTVAVHFTDGHVSNFSLAELLQESSVSPKVP